MHFMRANSIAILSVGLQCKLPRTSVNLSRGTTGIHTNPTCIQQSLVNLVHVSLHGVVNICDRSGKDG